jgi:hypothetical protein
MNVDRGELRTLRAMLGKLEHRLRAKLIDGERAAIDAIERRRSVRIFGSGL